MRINFTVTFAVEVPDDVGDTLQDTLAANNLEPFTEALRDGGFDANAAMPEGWELVNATVDDATVDEDPDDEDEDPEDEDPADGDSWDDGDDD